MKCEIYLAFHTHCCRQDFNFVRIITLQLLQRQLQVVAPFQFQYNFIYFCICSRPEYACNICHWTLNNRQLSSPQFTELLYWPQNWYSNMASFFGFVNKRASYPFGIFSSAHAPVNVTDSSIGSINVCDIFRKRKYKLPSFNQSILPNCNLRHIRIEINHESQNVF